MKCLIAYAFLRPRFHNADNKTMKKNPILRIYEATAPVFGKLEAREYVALTINHLILELEEAGTLTD